MPLPGQITATVTTAVGQTSTAVSTLTGTDTPAPGLTFSPAITTIPPEDDPVLVGAGDIAHCSSNGDEITADILDRIEGTVFTTGDNVYPSGTVQEFANCYEPSWGRHKGRTYPSPGNH